MIRLKSVKVKNFKSLMNLSKEFKNSKKERLIIIYGENGIGKTNFVEINRFLRELTTNLYIINEPKSDINNIKQLINLYKTIGSDENLEVEMIFQSNKYELYYYVELNSEEIVKEKIRVNKNEIEVKKDKNNDIKWNISELMSEDYLKEFETKIEQYWGKYSLLSIYFFEVITKNKEYLLRNIKKSFKNGIDIILESFTTVHVFTSEKERGYYKYQEPKGMINISYEKELDEYTEKLNIIFRSLYRDILNVTVDKNIENDNIIYEFKLEKRVCSKKVVIPFYKESRGTLKILWILPALLGVMEKEVILFFDELDSSIHDKMVVEILKSVSKNIKGQLILTTHNTKIMQEKELQNNVYVMIEEDEEKKIEKIKDYETRLHPNINPEKRYWKGAYGGIPTDITIDFSEVLDDEE